MTSATTVAAQGRLEVVVGEVRKLPAFVRRDLLVAWSYRLPFVGDWVGLVVQAFMFYFVGLLVDPDKLPTFGGTQVSYLEFVAVGIAISAFIQLALGRVAAGMHQEQIAGTLESLLMTPTSPATVQLGSVVYDLLYIPIRTGVFLVVVAVAFGLHFTVGGLLPAAIVLLAFIPFVWGLGVATAGTTLTFRRGSGFLGLGSTILVLFSGAFYPLDLLPDWVAALARLNPITIAVEAMRDPLLAGTGWAGVGRAVLILTPLSAVSLTAGILVFRAAVRRERRLGTLGLY
jgi:ABC-2 type transport system permease protein